VILAPETWVETFELAASGGARVALSPPEAKFEDTLVVAVAEGHATVPAAARKLMKGHASVVGDVICVEERPSRTVQGFQRAQCATMVDGLVMVAQLSAHTALYRNLGGVKALRNVLHHVSGFKAAPEMD
jgi:hypothetical protein